MPNPHWNQKYIWIWIIDRRWKGWRTIVPYTEYVPDLASSLEGQF